MAKYIVRFEDLVAIARRVGVTVVEAPSSHRGQIGEMGTVVGVTCHHTGTPNTYRPELEYPDFNVVKEGRPGLENSLSAFGLGRQTTIYVFSEDISWHAGVWLWKGITDGNGHFLGIEAAGIGDWTPFQRAAYPRLVASILLFIDADLSWAPRHLDGAMPPGRKTDAAHFEEEFLPGMNFDQSVQWLLDNPAYININYREPSSTPTFGKDDDDMPTIVNVRSNDLKKGIGYWMLDGMGYHWIRAVDTVLALRKAGCPEIAIPQREHDGWVADQDKLRSKA